MNQTWLKWSLDGLLSKLYLEPSWLDLQLPVQSVSITTKVVSSNPAHGEVYSIQHM